MERVRGITGLPVSAWDERLTTVQAERVLIEGGVRRERRREVIDQVAAVILLQSYLDAESRGDRT
jgi:putative pre-16S rRNA nuclease